MIPDADTRRPSPDEVARVGGGVRGPGSAGR